VDFGNTGGRVDSQQRIVATVEDSVLRTEMADLESQAEDVPKRILFFKPMSWLGQIWSHRRDETWSVSLWETFFSTSMVVQIPVIPEKPLGTNDRFFAVSGVQLAQPTSGIFHFLHTSFSTQLKQKSATPSPRM
jgi:hypothetical protein